MTQFAFDISCTRFVHSAADAGADGASVSFNPRNAGPVASDEVAQVYATLPADSREPFRRLVGWKGLLEEDATKAVDIPVDRYISQLFEVEKNQFVRAGGNYKTAAGGSSNELPLQQMVRISTLSAAAGGPKTGRKEGQ